MKKLSLGITLSMATMNFAQTNPALTSWLQNTTEIGSYYTSGNSTALSNGIIVNCQAVQYSTNWVYVTTNGVPSYPTGPFLDGNPSLATDQNAIFKFPLNPTQNTGVATSTTGGNIGVFINGVALFDYRDGVAWNSSANSLCGGLPGMSPCPGSPGTSQAWNRDAIPAEKLGFDCSKGHPAQGNYHHHQNPSAFKLDLNVISSICNLYDADGLYTIDSTVHSPLIGYAYDGFPIYGAYAYKNADGTGGIIRIKSGFQLRNISNRSVWADGTDVSDGPSNFTTYPLGYFREDYEFISHPGQDDYLDDHNGRFCVTPEYPSGIYCYFATVDENWNSAYPYAVGPTFYGNKVASKVTSISENVSTYTNSTSEIEDLLESPEFKVFPNPSSDLIVIQAPGLLKSDLTITLYDLVGQKVAERKILAGSTLAYFDVSTLYFGNYILKIANTFSEKVYNVAVGN